MQFMMVAEAVGGMVSVRFWGLVCDAYGQENGIQLSLAAKVVIPLALIVAPACGAGAAPLLILAYFIDGLMNAGFLIAWQGVVLKSTPRLNRGMYFGATNFLCQGLAGGVAPLIAGALIGPLNRCLTLTTGPLRWDGFMVIFAASVVLRLVALPIAWRLQRSAPIPFRTMMGHICQSNPLRAVRSLHHLQAAPRPERRIHAATELGRRRSPLAIGGLIAALHDPVLGVREAAADALGKIGMAEARQSLAEALSHPELGIQPPAARALGRIGGPESLKALLGSLEKIDAAAQAQAIEALAEIGSEAAILPLICLFEKVENPVLRRRIADALARLTAADSRADVMGYLVGM